MADPLLDDARQKLSKLELSAKDGDRTIYFKDESEMDRYKLFRLRLEKLYTRVVLSAATE